MKYLFISTGERPIIDILQDCRYWVIHVITIPALFISGVVSVASGILNILKLFSLVGLVFMDYLWISLKSVLGMSSHLNHLLISWCCTTKNICYKILFLEIFASTWPVISSQIALVWHSEELFLRYTAAKGSGHVIQLLLSW